MSVRDAVDALTNEVNILVDRELAVTNKEKFLDERDRLLLADRQTLEKLEADFMQKHKVYEQERAYVDENRRHIDEAKLQKQTLERTKERLTQQAEEQRKEDERLEARRSEIGDLEKQKADLEEREATLQKQIRRDVIRKQELDMQAEENQREAKRLQAISQRYRS